MRQNVLDAINEAAEADELVFTEDVLNDTTTLGGKYAAYSLKTLLETRAAKFAAKDYGTTPEDVADAVETTVGDYDAIATAFLTAYKNAAQADANAALNAASELVKSASGLKTATVTNSSLDALREAMVNAVKALINNPEIEVTLVTDGTGFPASLTGNTAGEISVTDAKVTLSMDGTSVTKYPEFDITLVYDLT